MDDDGASRFAELEPRQHGLSLRRPAADSVSDSAELAPNPSPGSLAISLQRGGQS